MLRSVLTCSCSAALAAACAASDDGITADVDATSRDAKSDVLEKGLLLGLRWCAGMCGEDTMGSGGLLLMLVMGWDDGANGLPDPWLGK